MRRRLLLCALLAVCIGGWTVAADARSPFDVLERIFDDLDIDVSLDDDATIRVGEDVRVEAGQRAREDLVAVNAGVRIGAGARADGTVVSLGGNIRVGVGGRVDGDVIAVNGDVHLAAGSRVDGDVVAIGGQVYKAAGVRVDGRVVELRVNERIGAAVDKAISLGAAFAPTVERAVRPSGGRNIERTRTTTEELGSFGGVIRIAPDVRHEGDIAVFGGLVDIAGAVDGDVAVMFGHVRIFTTGEVSGELSTFGSVVERNVPLAQFGSVPEAREGGMHGGRLRTRLHGRHGRHGDFGRPLAIINLVILASFGVVVLLFNLLLEPVLESADVELAQGYGRALFVGLILEVAVPPLVLLLTITVVLMPVALLLVVVSALGATVAMGLVSRQLGRRMFGGPGDDGTLARTLAGYVALAGLAALGQVLFLVPGAPPVAAWALSLLGYFVLLSAMTLGLGAVSIAQFGRWGRSSGAPPLPVTPTPAD